MDHRNRNRYPWEVWLRPPGFVAVRDVDFFGRTDSFVAMVRQRAIGRGLRLKIRTSDDGGVVRVEVREREPAALACSQVDAFSEN